MTRHGSRTVIVLGSALILAGLTTGTTATADSGQVPSASPASASQEAFLFTLQAAEGRTQRLRAKGRENERFTLKLRDVDPVTKFADRPFRDASVMAAAAFARKWKSWFADSPPNAVLTYRVPGRAPQSIVVTLRSASYDSNHRTMKFRATRIYRDHDPAQRVDGWTRPKTPRAFTDASLFIDDVGLQINDCTIAPNTDCTGKTLLFMNMAGADLHGSSFVGTTFAFSSLTGANLTWANFQQSTMTGMDLSGVNAQSAGFYGASLADANLTGAFLANTSLTGADFTGANLTDVNTGYSSARGANFAGADLTGAQLAYTDFTGANFAGANLTNANLMGSNLTNVTFKDATMCDTYVGQATMAFGGVFAPPSFGESVLGAINDATPDAIEGQAFRQPDGAEFHCDDAGHTIMDMLFDKFGDDFWVPAAEIDMLFDSAMSNAVQGALGSYRP